MQAGLHPILSQFTIWHFASGVGEADDRIEKIVSADLLGNLKHVSLPKTTGLRNNFGQEREL